MQQRCHYGHRVLICMLPSLLRRYCDHAAGLLDPMSVKRRMSLPVVVPTVVMPTYRWLDNSAFQ